MTNGERNPKTEIRSPENPKSKFRMAAEHSQQLTNIEHRNPER
jgi:hypothetical protein